MYVDGRTFLFYLYLGGRVLPQSLHQWPPYVLMNPLRSMFYARTLSIANMTEMKVDHYCLNIIDHESDYGAYL